MVLLRIVAAYPQDSTTTTVLASYLFSEGPPPTSQGIPSFPRCAKRAEKGFHGVSGTEKGFHGISGKTMFGHCNACPGKYVEGGRVVAIYSLADPESATRGVSLVPPGERQAADVAP